MAEEEPLSIKVEFEPDMSAVDRAIDERERKGITLPVRAEGGAGQPPRTPPTAAAAPGGDDPRRFTAREEREARAKGFGSAAEFDAYSANARRAFAEREAARVEASARAQERIASLPPPVVAARTPTPAAAGGTTAGGTPADVAGIFQQDIDAAMRRGDYQTANSLVRQAQGLNLNVAAPRELDPAYRARAARVEQSWGMAGLAQQRGAEATAAGYRADFYRTREQLEQGAVREAADERTAARLMERIPERDRPVVERMAQQRLQAGEEALSAIRQSVDTYHEDTRQHRDFLTQRQRVFEDTLRDMSPNEEIRAVRQRLRGMGPPPPPDDPSFPEYSALRRREQGLRGRTGLNTEVASTGLFMSLLFSGWEGMSAINAAAEADRFASMHPGDLRGQLRTRNASIDMMTRGPLGSWLGMLSGGERGRIAEIEGRANVTDARTDALAAFEKSSRARRQAAFVAGGGADDFEVQRRIIEVERENATRELKKELGTVGEKASKQRDTELQRIQSAYQEAVQTAGQGGAGVPTSAIERLQATRVREIQSAYATFDEAERKRQQELQAQIDLLNQPFDIQQRQLRRGRYRAAIGDVFGGAISIQEALGREYAAREVAINAAEATGEMLPLRARMEREALRRGTERRTGMEIDRLGYATEASRLSRGGAQLQADVAKINQQFLPMFAGNGRVVGFAGLDTSNTMHAQQVTAMRAAYTDAVQGAGLEDYRRGVVNRGSALAARAMLRRDPVGAGMAELLAEWAAATAGVTDPERRRELGEQFGLGLQSLRQSRADERQLLDINLTGREREIAALLARDETSAQLAGIVTRTRAEEFELRRAGLTEEADRRLKIGRGETDVLRRSYLDEFRAEQEGKDLIVALALSKSGRHAEDVGTVLGNMATERKGLEKPGQEGATVDDLKQAIEKLPDAIAQKIFEKAAQN